MGEWEFKLLAMAIIFGVGLGGGLAARRLAASENRAHWFGIGSALAGGIFLGAGLLHMLPDAAAGFRNLAPGWDYPAAFFLACLGFLLILFVERVLASHMGLNRGSHCDAESPPESCRDQSQAVYPYILALVLSVHSVLAGLALGAEKGMLAGAAILLAILAHKGSASFALAISLEQGGLSRLRVWGAVLVFSCMTPLGVLVGSAITNLLSTTGARGFEAIFDCLAAGTFLYIAVLDIIREEFFEQRHSWAKFATLCLGLAVMALLALWL